MKLIKRYFIAGLLVLVPVWVTFLLLRFIVELFDRAFNLLPVKYQPDTLLGAHIPGIGLVLTVILVFVIGILVTNIVGNQFIKFWELILARIPLVRSIYSGTKQVMGAMLGSSEKSFRKVLLVQYPHAGMWSIAFQTGSGFRLAQHHVGEDMVTVFIPTTPNPTSGFMLLVPKKDVIELELSVDEALKMVISLGVLLPQGQ